MVSGNTIWAWTTYLWSAVAVIWLVGAFFVKPVKQHQSPVRRVIHYFFGVPAIIFIFNARTGFGPLGERFLPESVPVMWAGFAIAAAGIAFAIWARLRLGTNWSGAVTIKHDHELIQRGPYALVRHPLYSGLLLGLAGTVLVVGEYRALVGLVLAVIALLIKSRQEEDILVSAFGDAYVDYRKRVKALIPFVL